MQDSNLLFHSNISKVGGSCRMGTGANRAIVLAELDGVGTGQDVRNGYNGILHGRANKRRRKMPGLRPGVVRCIGPMRIESPFISRRKEVKGSLRGTDAAFKS
jgi:hypothetical protein